MRSAARISSVSSATASATATVKPKNGHARSAGSTRPRPSRRAKIRRWKRNSGEAGLLKRRQAVSAYCTGLAEQLLELSAAVHLERDVAAADQLTLDVKLWISRPVREALERLAQLGLLEDVDVLELRPHGAQSRDGLRGKAALGEVGRALHEQHDRARAELRLDSLNDVHSIHLIHALRTSFIRRRAARRTANRLGPAAAFRAPRRAATAARGSSRSTARSPRRFSDIRSSTLVRPGSTRGYCC